MNSNSKLNRAENVKVWAAVFLLLLVLAVSLVLPLVRYSPRQADSYRIIVVSKTTNFDIEFWQQVHAGMKEAGREFRVDIDYRAPYSEAEIDRQIEIFREAILEKPDAIVLAASDSQRLTEPAKEAADAHIPLILVDSGLDNEEIAVTMVATDNVKAGERAGTLLSKLLDPGDAVAIITHNLVTSSSVERIKGMENALGTRFHLLPTIDSGGEKAVAKEEAAKLLLDKRVTAIFCTNEYTMAGTLEAVYASGVKDHPLLIGFDNSYALIDALENGTLKATVIQKAFNMGYLAIEKTVRHLRGEKLEPFYDSDSVLITRDVMYEEENEKLLFPFY